MRPGQEHNSMGRGENSAKEFDEHLNIYGPSDELENILQAGKGIEKVLPEKMFQKILSIENKMKEIDAKMKKVWASMERIKIQEEDGVNYTLTDLNKRLSKLYDEAPTEERDTKLQEIYDEIAYFEVYADTIKERLDDDQAIYDGLAANFKYQKRKRDAHFGPDEKKEYEKEKQTKNPAH